MLKLSNTLHRKKEEFKPRNGTNVGLYTCGPTVYNYAHIGNLRTYVFEDILLRTLKKHKFNVEHVMNITDVGHLTDDADRGEDKMEKGSKREGKTAWEIAEFYTKAFKEDIADLNILEPDVWCKATDHIEEQIDLVQTLIDKGHTYETSDGIYFDTTTIDDYGKLANLKDQDLQAGARVDMGEKKHPHDFALWKFSSPGEQRQMEWPAPFGAGQGGADKAGQGETRMGFPGWHIECSAMSMKYLGEQFDIHCGGVDHIPVHHTNEIAQSESATGKKPWVKYWLHGEFLLIDEGSSDATDRVNSDATDRVNSDADGRSKMSKSGENFITLRTLKEKGYDPLAYRYFLLQAHYRKQLSFSWDAMDAAEQGLKRLRAKVNAIDPSAVGDPKVAREFEAAVDDDLNMPEALAVLWTGLKENTVTLDMVTAFDKILGLDLRRHEDVSVPPEVQKLLDERQQTRGAKDWDASDRLRDEIAALGFRVEDTDGGQEVKEK